VLDDEEYSITAITGHEAGAKIDNLCIQFGISSGSFKKLVKPLSWKHCAAFIIDEC
jgi:hypothetical protein